MRSDGQPPHARVTKAVRVMRGIVTRPGVLIDGWSLGRRVGTRKLPMPPLTFALKPFRPFCNARWDAGEKMRRMADHLALAEQFGGALAPRAGPPRLLAALDVLGADWRLTCDEPKIMLNDGLSVLSLWHQETRLFSATILLASHGPTREAGPVILIGGLQGLADAHARDIYRDMTRDMHGLRPRDLMIELVRMTASALGIDRIFAVADDATYQSDPYFGRYPMRVTRLDYDAVWTDRGAVLQADGAWFDLPVQAARRDDADIPARKRALYRRRYAMLDDLADAVTRAVAATIHTQPDRPLPSRRALV